MATYSRALLSASTNGRPIALATSASPGTTIHTTGTSTSGYDEVYLWANNVNGTSVALTIEFGGTTTADRVCNSVSIPGFSPPIPILTGQVLNGSAVVRGFCDTASAIIVEGYVNRIS